MTVERRRARRLRMRDKIPRGRESRSPVGPSAEQDGGIDRKSSRNGDALALAAREFIGEMRQAVLELNERQQLTGTIVDLSTRPAPKVEWETNVLHTGQRRQQVEELKDEANLVPSNLGQLIIRQLNEASAIDRDGPRRRAIQTAHQVEQRGLSRARWSDNRHHVAGVDRAVTRSSATTRRFPSNCLVTDSKSHYRSRPGGRREIETRGSGHRHARLCESFHNTVKSRQNVGRFLHRMRAHAH